MSGHLKESFKYFSTGLTGICALCGHPACHEVCKLGIVKFRTCSAGPSRANAGHLRHFRYILIPTFKFFMLFHCNISFESPYRIRFPLFRQPWWTPCQLPAYVYTQSVEVTHCREWHIAMKIPLNNIKTASSNEISSLQAVAGQQHLSLSWSQGASVRCTFHWHRTEPKMTEPHLPLLREKYTACQNSACDVLGSERLLGETVSHA